MLMVNLESIKSLEKAGLRAKGYYDDYLKVASEIHEEYLLVTKENQERILKKYPEITPEKSVEPSLLEQGANIATNVANGIKSVVKTSVLRQGRVTEQEYNERLDVCARCPGNHVVIRNEKVYTCGSMIDSLRRAGKKTCGCILELKARDRSEDCPFGYWPTLEND